MLAYHLRVKQKEEGQNTINVWIAEFKTTPIAPRGDSYSTVAHPHMITPAW